VPGNCAPLLNRNNTFLATDAAGNKAILEQVCSVADVLCSLKNVLELAMLYSEY
jgi:hypothetical protein